MENLPDESDVVRRIVALKRYEIPPPGYFSGFSGRVISRIERGEAEKAGSWWNRFAAYIGSQPSLLGANALIVAGLGLLAGAVFIQKSHPKTVAGRGAQNGFTQTTAGVDLRPGTTAANFFNDRPAMPSGLRYQLQIIAVDSNQLPAGLFGQPQFPIVPVGLPGGR